jgi:flagellar biosynthesis regulator FlaF
MGNLRITEIEERRGFYLLRSISLLEMAKRKKERVFESREKLLWFRNPKMILLS